MSTEEKTLDVVKLSRFEKFVKTVRRTIGKEDADISFEAAIAFLYPKIWKNIKTALTQEYIKGYNDAKKEIENVN